MNVFIFTLFICFLLWAQNKFLSTPLRNTAQTFHKKSTSRLGGVAIYGALFFDAFYLNLAIDNYDLYRVILLCSIPIFIIGFLDDLFFDIKPWQRILIMIPSPVLLFYYAGLRVTNLSLGIFDDFLHYEFFALMFIVFALIGTVNAFNIIDGFNGLLLGYVLSIAMAISLYGAFNSEFFISNLLNSLFLAVFAVFIVNFPFGKIFLGDAGAYILGLLVPISIIYYYKVNDLSPWFVLIMLIYPVTEVFVSVVRKIIFRRMSAMEPDGLHLHMLIYKRISKKVGFRRLRLRHFIVALSIFIMNFPFLFFGNVFSDNTKFLMSLCLWYVLVYLLIYFILLPKYIFKQR